MPAICIPILTIDLCCPVMSTHVFSCPVSFVPSQLENKLKEKVDEEHIDKITFTDQLDRFHGVVSNCIHLWVQSVMSPCEGALNAMVKVNPTLHRLCISLQIILQ